MMADTKQCLWLEDGESTLVQEFSAPEWQECVRGRLLFVWSR